MEERSSKRIRITNAYALANHTWRDWVFKDRAQWISTLFDNYIFDYDHETGYEEKDDDEKEDINALSWLLIILDYKPLISEYCELSQLMKLCCLTSFDDLNFKQVEDYISKIKNNHQKSQIRDLIRRLAEAVFLKTHECDSNTHSSLSWNLLYSRVGDPVVFYNARMKKGKLLQIQKTGIRLKEWRMQVQVEEDGRSSTTKWFIYEEGWEAVWRDETPGSDICAVFGGYGALEAAIHRSTPMLTYIHKHCPLPLLLCCNIYQFLDPLD